MPTKKKITVRRWKEADIPALIACHEAAYNDYPEGGHYDARTFGLQFDTFPEGQFLAEIDGEIAGYATSLIIQIADDKQMYSPNYDKIN